MIGVAGASGPSQRKPATFERAEVAAVRQDAPRQPTRRAVPVVGFVNIGNLELIDKRRHRLVDIPQAGLLAIVCLSILRPILQ
jgi:hypothetical protein